MKRISEWVETVPTMGLYLWGDYGVGKTGLAVAILNLFLEGDGGHYVVVPDMFDRLRATMRKDAEETEEELMETWRYSNCLVLDDIGSEKPSEFAEVALYKIVNFRHGQGDASGVTIFTSNLSLGQLAKRIGERTAWRIAEMCEVIHVEGPNLRDRK